MAVMTEFGVHGGKVMRGRDPVVVLVHGHGGEEQGIVVELRKQWREAAGGRLGHGPTEATSARGGQSRGGDREERPRG